MLLLDSGREMETLRKIRKMKCIPVMVDVLWNRSRGDYQLHIIALELLFEVCRSERLSEEDLGTIPPYPSLPQYSYFREFFFPSCSQRLLISECISEEFIEYLLQELEEDYDEHYNMLVCRLIVPSPQNSSPKSLSRRRIPHPRESFVLYILRLICG
jgi:hypothetical protein